MAAIPRRRAATVVPTWVPGTVPRLILGVVASRKPRTPVNWANAMPRGHQRIRIFKQFSQRKRDRGDLPTRRGDGSPPTHVRNITDRAAVETLPTRSPPHWPDRRPAQRRRHVAGVIAVSDAVTTTTPDNSWNPSAEYAVVLLPSAIRALTNGCTPVFGRCSRAKVPPRCSELFAASIVRSIWVAAVHALSGAPPGQRLRASPS